MIAGRDFPFGKQYDGAPMAVSPFLSEPASSYSGMFKLFLQGIRWLLHLHWRLILCI
jgi:hypothetical protein